MKFFVYSFVLLLLCLIVIFSSEVSLFLLIKCEYRFFETFVVFRERLVARKFPSLARAARVARVEDRRFQNLQLLLLQSSRIPESRKFHPSKDLQY
jgi:hypothetical protein